MKKQNWVVWEGLCPKPNKIKIFVKNPNMLNKRKREIMPGREEEEKCHFWQALPVQDTQNEQDLTFYKCQNWHTW